MSGKTLYTLEQSEDGNNLGTNNTRKELMRMDRKQITLRIPGKVYEALKDEAADIGVSVNELIMLKANPLDIHFDERMFSK